MELFCYKFGHFDLFKIVLNKFANYTMTFLSLGANYFSTNNLFEI